jgi:hypothetical protein
MFIFALKVVCFFAKRACMRLVSCGSRQAGGQCVLQEIHLLLICMQTETVLCLRRNSSRILARKSAQRSRVRKLQYISELERSVTTLQVCTSITIYRYYDSMKLVRYDAIQSSLCMHSARYELIQNICSL